MPGVEDVVPTTAWERLAEDYAFIFYSCDNTGRIHYVNEAWWDLREHRSLPDFLAYVSLNQDIHETFDHVGLGRYLPMYELIRKGNIPYFEEIVPCHTPNQPRWMLQRIQRLGEEVIFSSYFLRHYTEETPVRPKIRCLTGGGNWAKGWQPDSTPFDSETTLALCPNCSLQFYLLLRQIEPGSGYFNQGKDCDVNRLIQNTDQPVAVTQNAERAVSVL
jgi:hypothetical protein